MFAVSMDFDSFVNMEAFWYRSIQAHLHNTFLAMQGSGKDKFYGCLHAAWEFSNAIIGSKRDKVDFVISSYLFFFFG